MAKEIIINSENDQTRIAILESGELVELYIENPGNERTIGDICLGRVRKIMPSIQAAFVDIGQNQDAFLHYSDLSDNLPDLLEFLQDPQPQVGKHKLHPTDHSRIRGKRRMAHPRGGRRAAEAGSKNGAPPSEDAAETTDTEDLVPAAEPLEAANQAEAPETLETTEIFAEQSEDAADPVDAHKAHRAVTDLRSRGHRRSAQRRTMRQEDAADDDEDEAPAPLRDNRPLFTYLKRDQRILVKVVKEPISSKGSRVSTDISLAGRFLVLVPLADYVAVSKKIVSYKERRRLRALAKSLLPNGFGVIVRTVAEGKNAKALDIDLGLLVDKWRKIEKKLAEAGEPPALVHEDVSLASSVIRDLFSEDYDRILIDDPKLYRNIKGYVQAVAPQMSAAVQMHKAKKSIFETVGIAREFEQAFACRVELPTGGYLFIERTEAMHVIDVNSGRSGRGMTQEENSLRVNLEAARVIARQIRLRDLGGIIVVDFIDLRDERNRAKIYDELKREFKKDRAVTKLLPMSDFGVVQITRQRLRPSITAYATADGSRHPDAVEPPARNNRSEREERSRNERDERSPKAERPDRGGERTDREDRGGRGERGERSDRGEHAPRGRSAREHARKAEPAPSPEDLLKRMEEWIVTAKRQGARRSVRLVVHPFTAAFLNRKLPNQSTRWFMKHLVRVHVEADEQLAPLAYRFLDPATGEDLTAAFTSPAL